MIRLKGIVVLILMLVLPVGMADTIAYQPSKVVYDITDSDPKAFGLVLDRANMLQNLYQNDVFESSIIVVIHNKAVPLVGKNREKTFPDLMRRAKSLTMGEIIEFRICRASAAMQGYKEEDIEDFVKMVPMADAEIIKLQQQGYAYMR